MDQDDVYEVVAAWNEHSEDVEAYVALQEESGLDTEGLKEAVGQWRQHKDEYAQYEALRRDTGMDAEGMRKVGSASPQHLCSRMTLLTLPLTQKLIVHCLHDAGKQLSMPGHEKGEFDFASNGALQ